MKTTPEKEKTALPQPHPLSILCVEDNPVDRACLTQQLKSFGYETDIAVDGIEALNAVIKKNYDMIFIDMYMPELDGAEAIRKIRYSERKNKKPASYIVGITAFDQKSCHDECLEAGANEYLHKPLKQEDLNGILKVCARNKVSS